MLPAPRDPMDLFVWPERQAISTIEQQRAMLVAEIAALKPRSAKRLWKQEQLRELTREELRLEADLERPK